MLNNKAWTATAIVGIFSVYFLLRHYRKTAEFDGRISSFFNSVRSWKNYFSSSDETNNKACLQDNKPVCGNH